MKTAKTLTLATLLLTAAALLLGAKDNGPDLPPNVDATHWLKISGSAGIVLTNEESASKPLYGRLFVRTDQGWRPVAIHNDALAIPLNARR